MRANTSWVRVQSLKVILLLLCCFLYVTQHTYFPQAFWLSGLLALGRGSSLKFGSWLLHMQFAQQGGGLYRMLTPHLVFFITSNLSCVCVKEKHLRISVSWTFIGFITSLRHHTPSLCSDIYNQTFLFIAFYRSKGDKQTADLQTSVFMRILNHPASLWLCWWDSAPADVVLIKSVQLLRRHCDVPADLATGSQLLELWLLFCPNLIHIDLQQTFNDPEKAAAAAEKRQELLRRRDSGKRNWIIPHVLKNWVCVVFNKKTQLYTF